MLTALHFSLQGQYIPLLFANVVLVLLRSSVRPRRLELRRSKALSLILPDAMIFFLCLMPPFALLGQRPHGQHGMGARAMSIHIVDTHIAHTSHLL